MVAKLGVVVIIARALGPYGQGVYGLFVATATITASLFVVGQNISGNYFTSRAGPSELGGVVANTAAIGVAGGLGALVSAGTVFFLVYAPPELQTLPVAILVGTASLLQVLQLSMAGVLLGLGQFRLRAQLQIVQQALLLVVVAGFASRHGVVGVIAAWTGAELLFWASSYLAALRFTRGPYRISRAGVARQLKHGLGSQTYMVAQNVNARVDVLVVGALFAPTIAGFYTVATSAAEAVIVIPKAMGDIVLSRIDAIPGWGTMRKVLALTASGAAAIGLVALAAGHWLLPLVFGGEYTASWPPLAVLTPGIVLGSTAIVGTFGLFGLSRSGPAVATTVAAAVTATVLAVPLALLLGFLGAAVASTVSYALHATLVYLSLKKCYHSGS
jgi:O-antigen/teichoic acid export membrane protein